MTYTIDKSNPLYPFIAPIMDAMLDKDARIEEGQAFVADQQRRMDELSAQLSEHQATIQELQQTVTLLQAERDDLRKSTVGVQRDRLMHGALFCNSERIPYVFGGTMNHTTASKRGAYDCSAFVQALYKSIGISLPRTSRDQATKGNLVALSNLEVGDLLFYDTNNDGVINHVSMYIGDRQMIHTNSPAAGINIQNVDTGMHAKWFKHARRNL